MSIPKNATQYKSKKNYQILTHLFSILRFAVIIGLISLIVWGWKLYKDPQFLPIHQVKIVTPYQKVSQQHLINIISPYTTHRTLLSVNIENLKEALLQEPWIYQVIIKRVWPDQITINIKEQKAAAIWNHQTLLNEKGDLFTPPKNTFPVGLPFLNCSPGQQQFVLEKMYQFNQALAPFNLSISTLNLNSRGSWQMILTDGITITLGRINPEQRFARLVTAYPIVLSKQVDNIARIDLRYPDGFAISWKQQFPTKITASQTIN